MPQFDIGYPERIFIPCVCRKYSKYTVLYKKRVIDSGHEDLENEIDILNLYPDADVSLCALIIAKIIEDYRRTYVTSSLTHNGYIYNISYFPTQTGIGVDITKKRKLSVFEYYEEYKKTLHKMESIFQR